MGGAQQHTGFLARVLLVLRAIVVGILVGLVAANVWPLLLLHTGVVIAAAAEAVFLCAYVWWASGGGPPLSLKQARAESFRTRKLAMPQWRWGLVAAIFFAVSVHAAIVVLFRLVPFPAQAFHAGYDFSFISSVPLRWLAVIMSAASAGICEETGFRGYMQQPIEKRHGPLIAIMISSLFFTLVHLTKGWDVIGMAPITFGAGVLLGALAWASKSLTFGMIGHTMMDVGLFAYWWTQIAGTFSQATIWRTGMDGFFFLEVSTFAVALLLTVVAISRLHHLTRHD
jgi:membrane protease YdiL (CAAX protease family)